MWLWKHAPQKSCWLTQKRLFGSGGNQYTSREDLRGAELTYYKYYYEELSKKEAQHVAEQELSQSRKTVSMCGAGKAPP